MEYLHITPDRSLVFTAMEDFMSSVRKASALYPGIIVVIDMIHVSAADFTTAYVMFPCLIKSTTNYANRTTYGLFIQGFNNMIKSLLKHGHKLVLTRTKPEVLLILSRMECDLHVHTDGTDMESLLKGKLRLKLTVSRMRLNFFGVWFNRSCDVDVGAINVVRLVIYIVVFPHR